MNKIDYALSKMPLLNIFSSKKMIHNQIVNRLGAQPFRIWLAEKRYGIRPKFLTDETSPHIKTLREKGIIVIPNFLPQEIFEQLEKECHHAIENLEPSVKREDGPNFYTNIANQRLKEYSTINAVLGNKKIEQYFKAAERRDVDIKKIVRLLSCLIQGEDNAKKDPETTLHEDTFFNTHKAWLYISDVEYKNAPFVYVKGSNNNKITDRYNKSYKYSLGKGNIHSRRISNEELNELNLEETHFLAKKNTFVMANTLGFHRRLRGEAGSKRIALAFSARFNPFI